MSIGLMFLLAPVVGAGIAFLGLLVPEKEPVEYNKTPLE